MNYCKKASDEQEIKGRALKERCKDLGHSMSPLRSGSGGGVSKVWGMDYWLIIKGGHANFFC